MAFAVPYFFIGHSIKTTGEIIVTYERALSSWLYTWPSWVVVALCMFLVFQQIAQIVIYAEYRSKLI